MSSFPSPEREAVSGVRFTLSGKVYQAKYKRLSSHADGWVREEDKKMSKNRKYSIKKSDAENALGHERRISFTHLLIEKNLTSPG